MGPDVENPDPDWPHTGILPGIENVPNPDPFPDVTLGGIDPWKHRSANMKCTSCMWFVEKGNTPEKVIGRCRRHAPTMGGYPVVYSNDWCGDHRINEERIS